MNRTGLDYGDQRYYSSQFGRFMSPDPYKASAGARDPQSWNHYAYVEGDPINYNDPSGQIYCMLGADGACAHGDSGGGGVEDYTGATIQIELNNVPVNWSGFQAGCACPTPPLSQVDWGSIWGDIRFGWKIFEIIFRTPGIVLAGRAPTVADLQKNCTPGRLVEEPATGGRYRGGISHEQEYICADGIFTVHWITDENGKIVHGPHIRFGPPTGGSGE